MPAQQGNSTNPGRGSGLRSNAHLRRYQGRTRQERIQRFYNPGEPINKRKAEPNEGKTEETKKQKTQENKDPDRPKPKETEETQKQKTQENKDPDRPKPKETEEPEEPSIPETETQEYDVPDIPATEEVKGNEEPSTPGTNETKENKEPDQPHKPDISDVPKEVGNRTTVGVEFEFLLAYAAAVISSDPHPNDDRFLATDLDGSQFDEDYNLKIAITVRNEIIDRLNANNIVAAKYRNDKIITEYLDFKPIPEFGWTGSLFKEPVGPNPVLDRWKSTYHWDVFHPGNPDIDNTRNHNLASQQMLQEFLAFHTQHNLPLHLTTHKYIDSIPDSRMEFTHPARNNRPAQFRRTRDTFKDLAKAATSAAMDDHEAELESSRRDPNFVRIPGALSIYETWTCTTDPSILPDRVGEPVLYNRARDLYRITDTSTVDKSYLDADNNNVFIKNPLELYHWYQGELRTPILDFDHEDTIPAIRRACAALRDNFRIHKPTSGIRAGLHIHFGQEAGWTLLQLKKFATLWLILEESLEYLHRVDRSNGSNTYSLPNRETSEFSQELAGKKNVILLSDIENIDPLAYTDNMKEKDEHILSSSQEYKDHVQEPVRRMIDEIWKHIDITTLCEGLTSDTSGATTYIKFRISGDVQSSRGLGLSDTIEIRIMQGTLDADHVEHWMKICERLIIWSRDSTPREFRDALQSILSGNQGLEDAIGVPTASMDWFRSRVPYLNQENIPEGEDSHFLYPDKDRVDWVDPFMVPGYKDTHQAQDEK
ncbi:hypothetical protein Daesc_000752 [Daldinia eschscholtzii]|uniref:Amidoligase enzyme protein n=1 Tax=Daldinia eschscholtzii TaxID=292717 RepID=A0AAX6N0K3_9PEZI